MAKDASPANVVHGFPRHRRQVRKRLTATVTGNAGAFAATCMLGLTKLSAIRRLGGFCCTGRGQWSLVSPSEKSGQQLFHRLVGIAAINAASLMICSR